LPEQAVLVRPSTEGAALRKFVVLEVKLGSVYMNKRMITQMNTLLRDDVRADGFKPELTQLCRCANRSFACALSRPSLIVVNSGAIGVGLVIDRDQWSDENRGVAVITGAQRFRVETLEVKALFFPRSYPRITSGAESITLFSATVEFINDGPVGWWHRCVRHKNLKNLNTCSARCQSQCL
jgi:hypothetical protein